MPETLELKTLKMDIYGYLKSMTHLKSFISLLCNYIE
jgi:hypothetical protein